MAVTERSRHNVHKHFEGTMGEELAATLMEMLPGVGWADVARRRDLDDLRVAMTQDLERFRAETKREFEQVRAETKREFEHQRAWAEAKFDAIDKRFESCVTHDDLRKNTYALITANAVIVTIAVTLARVI